MTRPKKPRTAVEVRLRRMLAALEGKSLRALARECSTTATTLSRFIREDRRLMLDTGLRLMQAMGFQIIEPAEAPQATAEKLTGTKPPKRSKKS
jgi:plasmid maintenance system antidote protein VapI